MIIHKKSRHALVMVLAMILPNAASAQDVRVDDSFGTFGFTWSRPPGAQMLIRFRPFIVDGELVVCGAYSNRGGPTITRLGREVMRAAQVKISGSTVMRDIRFFKVISNAQNSVGFVGSMAGCVNTERPTEQSELASFEIETRDGRYRVNR